MITCGFDDWQHWRQQGCTLLPVRLQRSGPPPSSWSSFSNAPVTVLLESRQTGRFTYLCDRPARIVIGRADGADILAGDGVSLVEQRFGRPLDLVQALLDEVKVPAFGGVSAMNGGFIGVFGYDLVHTWERLPMNARRDLPVPLYALVEARELFVYDHVDEALSIIVWSDVSGGDGSLQSMFESANASAVEALARWDAVMTNTTECRPIWLDPTPARAVAEPSLTDDEFKSGVRRAQAYIAAGHTYQVNLSRRTSRATALRAEAVYASLRQINPSPYMGLLRTPDFALVCGSPELLVKLVDGVISSRPIAGTRPRGEAPPEDSHFFAELFASEKERAEHLMLVDLIRNDIGRVAEFGSVRVPEFMTIERYSHVMHIVSQVEGRLAAGKNWADVLRSMFPGGTITGCPKFRTMEIIDELEPVGRGFYTGTLGWISYRGDMEMNIVIRSMLMQHGVAHVQAGAGIVADSQPARELDETARKAQALWAALDAAENAATAKQNHD